jgi:O-antigen/teichoic acid export membrane protein
LLEGLPAMTVVKRAFNNFFWLFWGEVISKGLMFLGTVYLARVLGKAGFGLYSLALAVGFYFWTIVDMGISAYGTREVARDKEKAAELYCLLNSLRFMLAIILFIVFWLALYLVDVSPEKRLILLAGVFYVVGYSLSPDWIFRGLEKMQYIAIGNIIAALFFVACLYLFIKDFSGTFYASIIYSGSILTGSLVSMILLHKKIKIPFFPRISFSQWWIHVKDSFYFGINKAFNTIELFIPIFFIGIWNTAEDLGIFSAPHRLTSMMIYASSLSLAALYPILSNLYVTNINDFKMALAGFQKMILWIVMPFCIIASIFSKSIVIIIFGINYAESAKILTFLIWFFFLTIIRYSFGIALISANFHRFNMFATGAGAAFVTLSCMILIPKYGGYGAACALICGEIVTLLLMVGLFKTKLGFSGLLRAHIIKILFASAFMVFILEILHLTIIPSIFTGIISYGLLSLSTGVINKKNIQEILMKK